MIIINIIAKGIQIPKINTIFLFWGYYPPFILIAELMMFIFAILFPFANNVFKAL